MKIIFQILRFNPEKKKSYKQEFRLKNFKGKTILEALLEIKKQDPTLAFRYSCRSGICGSCAVRINGKAKLACETQVKDVLSNDKIVIEPLKNFTVKRDLIVDIEPLFNNLKKIKPWLVPDKTKKVPEKEFLIIPDKNLEKLHSKIDHCILCGICSSDCDILDADKSFIGPASFIKAYRFILDPRDSLKKIRLKQLAGLGLLRCSLAPNCRVKCPKGIKIHKDVLSPLQRLILKNKLKKGNIN